MWGKRLTIGFLAAGCLLLAETSANGADVETVVCKGKVIGPDSEPVAAARVTAYGSTYDGRLRVPGYQTTAQTDSGADGTFTVKLKRGLRSPVIVAQKDGLALGWDYWHPDEAEAELAIRLVKPSVLSGTVVDGGGDPIAGAEVRAIVFLEKGRRLMTLRGLGELNALVCRTGADGRFRFASVPPGSRADFLVKAAGRATQLTAKDRPYWSRGEFKAGTKDIRIVLEPEAKIEGIVIEGKTLKPVAGIGIFAEKIKRQYEHGLCASDKDGRFQVWGLSEGVYRLQLVEPETHPAEWAAVPVPVVTRASKTSDALLKLTKGGIVQVKVTDTRTGEPVDGARVSLSNYKYDLSVRCRTDREGLAVMRLVPAKYSVIGFYAKGYSTGREPEEIVVAEAETQRIAVKLTEKLVIRGTVRDAGGKPVAGASVALLSLSFTKGTDEGGRFQLPYDAGELRRLRLPAPPDFVPGAGRPPEPARLYVVARDPQRNLAAAVEIKPDAESVDVELAPGLTLVGKVTDPDGKAIPEVWLTLSLDTWRGKQGARGGFIGLVTEPGTDGRYKIPAIPPGHGYRVTARARGYTQSKQAVGPTVKTDEPIEIAPIVLKPANLSISGVVVDERGNSVAGASVRATGEGQPWAPETSTDADGRFRVAGLCKGTVWLYISAMQLRMRMRDPFEKFQAGAENIRIVMVPAETDSVE